MGDVEEFDLICNYLPVHRNEHLSIIFYDIIEWDERG